MPRKSSVPLDARPGVVLASMRPRPDAAEKAHILDRHFPDSRFASMRPRPDAAEKPLPATHCDSRCSPPRRERSRDPDRQAEPDACRLTTGAL